MNCRLAYYASRSGAVCCLFFWLSNIALGQMEEGMDAYNLNLSNKLLPELLLELKVITGIELEVTGALDFNLSQFSVIGNDLSVDEIIKKAFKDYDYVTMGNSEGANSILILVTGLHGTNTTVADSVRNAEAAQRSDEEELQNIIAQIEENEVGTLSEMGPADKFTGDLNVMENGIVEVVPENNGGEGENSLPGDYELNYTEEGILELIAVDHNETESVNDINYIRDFTGPGGELELIRIDDHQQTNWETFTGPEGITEAFLIKN